MQQLEDCLLCQGPSIEPIVNHALYDKYSSSQDFYYTKQINEIMQQQLNHKITKATVDYKQYIYIDEDQEYMRRFYQQNQYHHKITMLSQYYKFHRDMVLNFDLPLQKILSRYYQKVRDLDYKRIKNLLKQQQNISLTTHKTDSQSQPQNSSYIKKSKYSTLLHQLDQNSQSQSRVLLDICQKIDQAYGKDQNIKQHFKGFYVSGQRKFQSFLQKQTMKKHRIQHGIQKMNKINQNNKINKFDSSGTKQSLNKLPSSKNLWRRSMQKTTANETLSRQQKIKKLVDIHNKKQQAIQLKLYSLMVTIITKNQLNHQQLILQLQKPITNIKLLIKFIRELIFKKMDKKERNLLMLIVKIIKIVQKINIIIILINYNPKVQKNYPLTQINNLEKNQHNMEMIKIIIIIENHQQEIYQGNLYLLKKIQSLIKKQQREIQQQIIAQYEHHQVNNYQNKIEKNLQRNINQKIQERKILQSKNYYKINQILLEEKSKFYDFKHFLLVSINFINFIYNNLFTFS